MVRPVISKRKLFNNSKDQFKENEPDQLRSSVGESYSTKTQKNATSFYPNVKILNESGKRAAEGSVCSESRREKESLKKIEWQRRCDFEDGGTVITPQRTVMPMSERQQIALLLQLSSPSPTGNTERSSSLDSPHTPTTPHFGRGLTKRNERGETPLHVAAIKGDHEKVSALIAQGVNVNATDYAGWTALHEACNKGFLVITSLLIQGGADVNAKGLDNDTPLHDACVNNHSQIARLLLQSGAKTDAINSRGKTPFDVCRSTIIFSLLEEAKTGKLHNSYNEREHYWAKPQGIRETTYTQENINNNNEEEKIQDYSVHFLNSEVYEMSRKTPPSNKTEEKPSVPSSSSSSIPTSTTGGERTSSNGSGATAGGNGRPLSPRVTLRLPHVQRTPDKTQRPHDAKNSSESEDVYEFRCSKEETNEQKEEKSEGGAKGLEHSTQDPKVGDKRSRETDAEDEDELKNKRRKEEAKEGAKTASRGAIGRLGIEKCMKIGQRASQGNGNNTSKAPLVPVSSTAATSNIIQASSPSTIATSSSVTTSSIVTTSGEPRKSPSGSAATSPKALSSGAKSDSDGEEAKSESGSGAPKVPPLKIVLAPMGLGGEQETSSSNGKNGANRQLPYVVNSNSGNTEDKEGHFPEAKDVTATVKEEISLSTSCSSTTSGTSLASSVVGTTSSSSSGGSTASISSSVLSISSSALSQSVGIGSTGVVAGSNVASDKGSATRITRSQRGGGGSNSSEEQGPATVKSVESKIDEHLTPEVVHPRKRKIKMKEPESEQIPPSTVPEQPVTNCYEMFLKIRKQVERKRKLLFPVQPKPPQGFKDYLMNRCSYVLANSSNSQMSVPVIPAPTSLTQALKDLFNEQEQERYKLRLQHLIEREKLVLSVEQEILRVHGRAARALANQVHPFSVCTILKDEEVYNVLSPEQEDRNARSRYNGRLFISWLQDVDDKWEKIKEAMVLRHHNEAESLHAVQKMDWEWKLKELGLVDPNTKTQIEEHHVPMVQVADFDLLPV